MRTFNWLLIGLLFLFGFGTTSALGQPRCCSSAQAIPITFTQISSTVVSENGLSLTLSIDSTSYQPGQQVTVTISEKNTLTTKDSMEVASAWFVQGLNLGPCVANYPFGISVLQGYYDMTNVSSATPLNLYGPPPPCPVNLAVISAYDFQPLSDTAIIYSSYNSQSFEQSIQMTAASVNLAGYWVYSPVAGFTNFTPGVYTVVGGDEWGALVTLHFTVTPATAVTSPHQKPVPQARIIPQGCVYNIRGALVSSSGRRGQIPGVYFIKSGGTGLLTVIR